MSALRLPADCLFLTGPTASGKTQVGLELARRLGGEILSLDSMAVYRGMDIGTAKPSPAERVGVRHHLIDLVEPAEDFSVAQYVATAEPLVNEITQRGREPLFVGGTPLYLKALLRGLFAGPAANWPLRAELNALAREAGPHALHERLSAIDPVAAARLPAADERRIIRAIEVFEHTGRPISEYQQQFDHARPAAACRVFVLDWPRAELYERIDRRVDGMFSAGLVAEVGALVAGGAQLGRTASQAVGYREVLEHLEGRLSLDATIALVKTRTRQFAKRQLTWFRSLSECRHVPVSAALAPAAVAEQIARQAADSGFTPNCIASV
jgi:tRNA dimethylallyltransferase